MGQYHSRRRPQQPDKSSSPAGRCDGLRGSRNSVIVVGGIVEMERTPALIIGSEEASSLELAIQQQQQLEITSIQSAAVSPSSSRQHTCTMLSVSPPSSSSTISSLGSNGSALEFVNDNAVAAKKCTCPYERPTLKTMEAAARQKQLHPGQLFGSSYEERVDEEEELDSQNNNHNFNLLVCDSESDRGYDANANPSIIRNVNSSSSNNNLNNNRVSGSPEEEHWDEARRSLGSSGSVNSRVSATTIGSGPKAANEVSGSIKSTSRASVETVIGQETISKCSCPVYSKKVKAGDQSPPRSSSSKASGSSSDGILSNCLSALNFVSGNRISGSAESSRSPRGSKSASKSDDSELTNQMCGEHGCKKAKGSMASAISAQSMEAPSTSGKSVKPCKSCRTPATAAKPSTSSSSSGGSKDKDGHPVKSKRSNWTLRFNCARLKGSKSSSSSSSPSQKESVCLCSPESKTAAATTTKAQKNSKKAKVRQEDATGGIGAISGGSVLSNNSSTSTEPTARQAGSRAEVEATNGSAKPAAAESLQNRITGVEQANFGSGMANLAGGKQSTRTTTTVNQLATVSDQQDCARLSALELSTEDCDEWARMQREKEIEDGVEAPPGYLPKFQFNKIQSAAAAANQMASQQQQPQAASNGGQPSCALPTATASDERQPQLATAASIQSPTAALGALNSPWPHVLCSASSPELSMEQRLAGMAPKVHSQVDFIHCLVPDLQKITSCGFYWGKMDRYQAETLLDGKPEGTFLLRDSAQEEFLFSVSFRKYGRSLHARIEQFNHKFSFDSHDPGVYTANTVTGLLEHYKDPSCVMFFEPMLTQPLNRNFCFSLQQLCRATIVSNTTYDNIGDLKLPHVMKAYLKEYHYKQKVRVKMFDELSSRMFHIFGV